MRKAIAIVLIATISVAAIVGSVTARLLPNDQQGPEPERSATQLTAPSSSSSQSNRPESVEPTYLYPVLYPVLDLDYDDSWVANIPEFISGYRVLSVDTPKSYPCSDWPLITFHATQKSLDEYVAAAPDMKSLRTAVLAVPGVPSDIRLSFAGARLDETGEPIDKEERALREKSLIDNIARIGCQDYQIIMGGPIVESPDTSAVPGDDEGLTDAESR